VARRDDILDAALRSFDERGVLATSIEDIRAASGASIGSIYHHFGDKEGIAEALYVEVLGRYQDAFLATLRAAADAREGVRGIVAFHLRWAAAHPAETRWLLAGRPSGAGIAARNRAFFGEVRRWWDARPQLRRLGLAELHALWLGPATELSRHWLAGHAPKPSRVSSDLLSDAAWRSLST
jgi:AcrR family transcriptional regulator